MGGASSARFSKVKVDDKQCQLFSKSQSEKTKTSKNGTKSDCSKCSWRNFR